MRPIDRRGSNPARTLGGLLAFGALVFGLTVAWHALFVWIGGAV